MFNPSIAAATDPQPADAHPSGSHAVDADRLARSVCAWAIVGDLTADNLLDTTRPDAAIAAADWIEQVLAKYLADPFTALAAAGYAVVQLPEPDFTDDGVDYWLDGELAVDCTSSRVPPEIRHVGSRVTCSAGTIGRAWLAADAAAAAGDKRG